MDKALLNEFWWIVNSFDRDRDGSLDDSEAMFAMNALGVIAEARSDEEQSLYELSAVGVDIASFDIILWCSGKPNRNQRSGYAGFNYILWQ